VERTTEENRELVSARQEQERLVTRLREAEARSAAAAGSSETAAQLQAQLDALQRAAQSAAAGREAELAQLRASAGRAEQHAAERLATLTAENQALSGQLTQAIEASEKAVASAAAASRRAEARVPPEDLARLQRALADAQEQVAAQAETGAALRHQAAVVPRLEQRVRELEQERSVLLDQRSNTAAIEARLTETTAARSEAEQELAAALRSLTARSEERDQLVARVTALEQRPPVSTPPNPAVQAELESLRARVVAAERTAFAAQTELARLSPPVASPRPAAPESSRVTFAVREPARPSLAPAAAVAVNPPRPAAPTPASQQPMPRVHTVEPGETLSGISRRYYGTPNRWMEILSANRDVIRDERTLIAGRSLRIP
jgi:nucleoid-associated protein YgaU